MTSKKKSDLEKEIESLKEADEMNEKHILHLEEELANEKETMAKLEEILQDKEKKLEAQEALKEGVFAELNRTREQLEVSHMFSLEWLHSRPFNKYHNFEMKNDTERYKKLNQILLRSWAYNLTKILTRRDRKNGKLYKRPEYKNSFIIRPK